jgi:acyl-CoA thioesterase I
MKLRKLYHCLIALCLCLTVLACDSGTPITKPVTIVAFGDSLTDGYRLPTEQSVPARLQARFVAAGHTGIRVMNMGISGDTTNGGLGRLNLVLNENPDIVILELGVNDLMRRKPVEETRKNLSSIIEMLMIEEVEVILCGIELPAAFIIGSPLVSEYEDMYDELADTYGLEYYPNFLKGVQGNPDYNMEDGMHPNAKGAQIIADKIYPLVLDVARDVSGQ